VTFTSTPTYLFTAPEPAQDRVKRAEDAVKGRGKIPALRSLSPDFP
jgi:hypothetical protein